MKNNNSLTFVDTKPHYALLDGLRGVAALLVVWYHIFEGYAFAGGIIVEVVNHGYLAVDFFFILSGFVISYAYDDRIGKKFTFNGLLKHRLIRLHPMVIMGALIGTVAYCIQGRMQWNGTQVPFHIIIGSLLLGLFFIPILPKSIYDVRGNGEMFPLNGPCWSLFFEYITNIAHEIKTPLTLIKTPLEYIMRNKSLDKNTQETLDIMMRNTERLLSLTYQLLDFQRVETKRVQLNFERTDINLLLKSIYRRFKLPSEQYEREFSLLLPEDSLFADVDLEAFTKIISNLFTNASKYSLSEIKVELTTVANNSFCVIVENDGELIEPTMREAIFEPFVQVSSQGPISSGRGLGLPLARSLAQLHGGSLILDTTCIERNRFVLNLPCFHQIRTDDIELKDEESISITNVKFSEKPAMLIVEDNLEMQDFISKRLMDKYDVYRAADGLEALKVLKEFDIDIVVSDIMMPNMDGMELLKNIKETVEYSHIPVILLSAKSDLESRINGLELGADAYIEKPFSLEYLMAQIQNLLMNRKSIKELFYKRPFIEANVVALTKTDELFLKKMNEIIEKNIDNTQFSVDVLTEKMNMSRSSLHRKIKGVTDLTPNDYIRLQRLKRAASLLCESGYRVNEIASLTGFTSASYFTKCFHQHFGMLPKEFIKQSGSSNNLTE